MPDTSYTQEDLNTLEKAIKQGIRVVRMNNRTVEYQSVSQMIQAKNDILKSLREQAEIENPCNRRGRAFSFRMTP